jgi:signal transduction histidine kinase
MRLSTRLMVFFLGSLALVLAGFSGSLYLLAWKYLHRQADERLEAALNTLVAAAEVNEAGVEWEPAERKLSFGRRTVEGPFFWQVSDGLGHRVDGSLAGAGDDAAPPPGAVSGGRPGAGTRPWSVVDARGRTWRVMLRRLSGPAQPQPPGGGPAEAQGRIYESLEFRAATSLEGVDATLRNLAVSLAGLSSGVWALALVSGRRLCRRALRPVSAMAEAAHAIEGDEPGRRLPAPDTQDELGELGRSFNALLDRLQESFERQRRFTGDASHQLRTPLTAVQGQVDLALRRDRTPEEYRRVLSVVQRRVRHLRQIVEALLFLARADAESLRPGLTPMDLASWAEEHLRSWPDARRAPDLSLALSPDPGGPFWVRAHPSLLAELVNNLLDNACKYSAPGTPIVVRLGRRGREVMLSVEDRGAGISPREVPHLFEPFYRSEAARHQGVGGVGLGLSVALRLAGALGGTIDVESEQGRGSAFTVRLPAEPEPPDAPPVAAPLDEAGVEA